jgi:hypothetical protein
MAGRFLFNGSRNGLGNRRRTKPQTFRKRLHLKIQRLVFGNSSEDGRVPGRSDGWRSGLFGSKNLRLHLRYPAAAQLRRSYRCAIAPRMQDLDHGRRAINREKRVVEKERGEKEADAHLPG